MWHPTACSETGKVYSFGTNKYGELGLVHPTPPYMITPTPISSLRDTAKVACGRHHSAAIDGELISMVPSFLTDVPSSDSVWWLRGWCPALTEGPKVWWLRGRAWAPCSGKRARARARTGIPVVGYGLTLFQRSSSGMNYCCYPFPVPHPSCCHTS